MRNIFVFLLLSLRLFGCSGDCLSCHPKLNLESDVRHKSLATCVTCHTAESIASQDMGAACGQDCFVCHDAEKLTRSDVAEHGVIKGCIACHTSLDRSLFSKDWQNMGGFKPPMPTH